MADATFDAKGLKCPMPIAKISGEIKKLNPGQTLEVFADDLAFSEDIKAFCRVSGHELESLTTEGNVATAIIKKS